MEEAQFRLWAQTNGIQHYDSPDAYYDMRGFWKSTQGAAHPPGSEQHFPDTFKQHGHPTFSVESQYSAGPYDGGRWADNAYQGDAKREGGYIPPGADFLQNSRGQARQGPDALAAAIQILMGRQ